MPPHPRPLSPVSRGRGGILGERGRQSAVVCAFRGSGFPARDLPFCVWIARGSRHWGMCFAGNWSHAKPRRREGKCRGRCRVFRRAADGSPRVWRLCGNCGGGLACGCVLGRVVPFTPDPSPPFHGGEGGLWASGGRESAVVCAFRGSGFPARDLPFCVWIARGSRHWGMCFAGSWSHAKARREMQRTVLGVQASRGR